MDQETRLEQRHLKSCLSIIRKNIRTYEIKAREYQKEITELTTHVRKGEGDSYGALLASRHILEHTKNSIRKGYKALEKAYFGRIDYRDLEKNSDESLYIGKNGVTVNQTEVVIVDWRAPVSSVYYENELGKGSYAVPDVDEVAIDLTKKRTYDISGEELLGFYDNDVAANDELLVKYLSSHKEAVLGDIIATIQKEQNEIIRDVPYKHMIVQGVAGSGKTTVALHRISYLLYNYENRYKPSEFCIVCSSDMLLNYIGSGLPELDVHHVRQLRMDQFLLHLMGKDWKKNYTLTPDNEDAPLKSKLPFIRKLERFLWEWRNYQVPLEKVRDEDLGVLLSAANVKETFKDNRHLSLFQLEKLLNARLASRIRSLCAELDPNRKKNYLDKYRHYYHSDQENLNALTLYDAFLSRMEMWNPDWDFSVTREAIQGGNLDLYDAAALALIRKRIFIKKETDEFSHIIIDEAQDFGEMIYYVLKSLLPACYFTILGDVSQNIRFETGMNDWEGLKSILFDQNMGSFYVLSKSYRNTIEISACARTVLQHASQGTYHIQPVIRHGREVCFHRVTSDQMAEELIHTTAELQSSGYQTIGVICPTELEAYAVRMILRIPETTTFENGVMVLPVTLTKGLEFDAVILWKPDGTYYTNTPKDAKLFYVAITRALHELHMILDQESPFFPHLP